MQMIKLCQDPNGDKVFTHQSHVGTIVGSMDNGAAIKVVQLTERIKHLEKKLSKVSCFMEIVIS